MRGILGADPEIRSSRNEKLYASFPVAVSRGPSEEGADWYRCTFFSDRLSNPDYFSEFKKG